MNLFNSIHEPLDFKIRFGVPKSIYSTTFSKDLFAIFLISILALIVGIISLIKSPFNDLENNWITPTLITIGMFIPSYIYLGNRFRYVALFENGLVLKKRFSVVEIFYRDINNVSLINARPYKNLFKIKNNKEYAIDIELKNGQIISYGASIRIFPSISFLRTYTGIKVIDIKKLVNEINQKLHPTMAINNAGSSGLH